MKAEIHPAVKKVKFVCSCGESGDYVCEAYSTIAKDIIKVEVCSYCHPFYTGKQRIVDTGGRVEKFMKKKKAAQEHDARAKRAQANINSQSENANLPKGVSQKPESLKEEISNEEVTQSPPVQIELIEQPQDEKKVAEVTADKKKPAKKRTPRKKKSE